MENRCICGENFLDGFGFDPETRYLAVQSKKRLKQGAPPATNSTLDPPSAAHHPSPAPSRESQTGGLGGAHWLGGQWEEDFHLLSCNIPSL